MKRNKGLERGAWLAAGALSLVIAGCGGNSGGGSGSGGTVATVAGQTITRGELQGYSEAKIGSEALSELIDFNLVMADLKAKGLEVTDAEINAFLEQRRTSSDPGTAQQIARMLSQEGPIKEAMQRQARLRIAIEKLLTKDIKASDTELKAWFDKNKATLYPEKVKVAALWSSQKPRADAMLRQLNSKAKTFQNLVDEQKALKDEVGKGSSMETSLTMSETNPTLRTAITKLQVGEISPVITLGAPPSAPNTPAQPPVYVIIRLEERTGTTFEQSKAQIEKDYKIQQLARRQVQSSGAKVTFAQAEEQVQQQAAQQAMMQGRQPTMMAPRDVWTLINRGAEQEYINNLRQKGNVQITEPFYQEMQAMYKPAPASGSIMPAPGSEPAPGAAPGAAPGGAPAGGAAAPAGGAARP